MALGIWVVVVGCRGKPSEGWEPNVNVSFQHPVPQMWSSHLPRSQASLKGLETGSSGEQISFHSAFDLQGPSLSLKVQS